ncbi:MAG: hypothetical protein ACJ754_02865 [Pyrinomonadaceae bacterium]
MKKSLNRISGAFMTLLMLAGISVVAGSSAQAQYRQYPDGRIRQERRDRRWDRRDRDGDGDYDRRDEYIRRQQEAQRRNNGYGNYGRYGTYGGYGNNGGYNQAAMDQGYQAGLNTGASDAQRGQSYNPQRSHYYKNASSQAFLQGFTQGYDQGYRQYAGYNNGRYRTGSSNIGNILGGIFGRP